MPRANLVVVRAGNNSLHRNWLKGAASDPGARNWDLVVSWYARERYEPVAGERWIPIPGGKLGGLRRTFDLLPDLLESYDYIWLPDDDIDTDCASIDRLFEIMRQEKLRLGQPSLTMNSYFSWIHTLNCAPFRLRYTDMVEMMAPCFERNHLRETLPHFPTTIAGWGIDYIWGRLDEDNDRKSAIIDAVQVRHTRPVGNTTRSAKQRGEDPHTASVALQRSFGLFDADPFGRCYGGTLSRGGAVLGRRAVAMLMVLNHYLRLLQSPDPGRVKRMAPRHFRERGRAPDLSRLSLR